MDRRIGRERGVARTSTRHFHRHAPTNGLPQQHDPVGRHAQALRGRGREVAQGPFGRFVTAGLRGRAAGRVPVPRVLDAVQCAAVFLEDRPQECRAPAQLVAIAVEEHEGGGVPVRDGEVHRDDRPGGVVDGVQGHHLRMCNGDTGVDVGRAKSSHGCIRREVWYACVCGFSVGCSHVARTAVNTRRGRGLDGDVSHGCVQGQLRRGQWQAAAMAAWARGWTAVEGGDRGAGHHSTAGHRGIDRGQGQAHEYSPPQREFMHRARTAFRYLNNFSRKWSIFEDLVNAVPWWKLLGEEVWQGVRAPWGELTCNRCSNRLKDDKSLHTRPSLHAATLPQSLLLCQVQFWAKA